MPWSQPEPAPPERQPVFKAPLSALLLALSMPALFWLQLRLPGQGAAYAFAPIDLIQGRFGGLFTAMLLHANWAHALMNALGAFTFGPPVARLLGAGRGVLAFFALYIVCGVLAAVGFAVVHWGGTEGMVGASGAVFGLIGAATRLLAGRGRVAPLTDRNVLSMSAAWMAVNLFTGLIGLAPGAEAGARIAWEAHAAGFIAGLLLIGPVARWAVGSGRAFDSPERLGDPDAP